MGTGISKAKIDASRANIKQHKNKIKKLTEEEKEKMKLEDIAINEIDKICTNISSNLDEIKKSYALKFKRDHYDDINRMILNIDNKKYINNKYVKSMYDNKDNKDVYIYTFSLNFSLLKEVLKEGFDILKILDFFRYNIPTDSLKPEVSPTVSTEVPEQLLQVPDNIKLNETLKLLLLYLYNCHIIDIVYIYNNKDVYSIYKDQEDINKEEAYRASFTKSDENVYLTLAKVLNHILLEQTYNRLNSVIKIRLSNKEEDQITKLKKQINTSREQQQPQTDALKPQQPQTDALQLQQQSGGNNKNKLSIIVRKEILGKERCIYKKVGDRKEYVKHKGDLITVKDYKRIIKAKNNKRK